MIEPLQLDRPADARRLVEFKIGCQYGRFRSTKAYDLIAAGKIKAYKLGHKTMIDLNTVDEYHKGLQEVTLRRKVRYAGAV
jgi:hypothetical protein